MSKISESCYRLAKLGEVLDFKEMLLARGKSLSDELKRQISAAGHTTSDPALALLSGLAFEPNGDVMLLRVVIYHLKFLLLLLLTCRLLPL